MAQVVDGEQIKLILLTNRKKEMRSNKVTFEY